MPGRVTRGGDCDDRSIAIGPDMLDACGVGFEGIDDDCDGQIDEDGGAIPTYADADGDGFGAGAALMACTVLAGRVGTGGDCDDTDPAMRPGITESCAVLDDRDNDCDGFIDCDDPDCAGALLCGPPASLAVVSGGEQTAWAGFPLLAPIVVRATNLAGAPVAGAAIRFRATSGASVRPSDVVPNADGTARAYARMGLAPGDYDVTVFGAGATPILVREHASVPPDRKSTRLNASH